MALNIPWWIDISRDLTLKLGRGQKREQNEGLQRMAARKPRDGVLTEIASTKVPESSSAAGWSQTTKRDRLKERHGFADFLNNRVADFPNCRTVTNLSLPPLPPKLVSFHDLLV